MRKTGRFVLFLGKWILIFGGIYTVATLFSGLDFETRIGWFLAALAFGIAYVDSSHKDRIAALEYRVDELNRQLNGRNRY